jgi:C-methyltransferase
MPRKPTRPPPRIVFSLLHALRALLARILRRLVPARVALLEQFVGVWSTQMLYVAAKLEIAEALLDGPKTPFELARATGADEDALARVLRALASTGVFERRRDGRYRLNRMAEPLLANRPDSMRDILMFLGSEHCMRAWGRFSEVVARNTNAYRLVHGQSIWEYLAEHPEEGAIFHRGMVNMTELDAPALVFGFDYSRFASVCDVGGGRGSMLGALLSANPTMRGVLLDAEDVVAAAGPTLAAWGVERRCTVTAGDFFGDLPVGCDAYILKDIVHDWADERATEILRACRRAMGTGATLLIMEMVVEDDARPHFGKLLDLEMLDITEGGRQRSESELEGLLAASGFRLRRVHALPSPVSIVEAVAV